MKPCISQATTLKNPFEADLAVYRAQRLDRRRDLADQARIVSAKLIRRRRPASCSNRSGIKPVAAASQGGLLLSQGAERATALGPLPAPARALAELESCPR